MVREYRWDLCDECGTKLQFVTDNELRCPECGSSSVVSDEFLKSLNDGALAKRRKDAARDERDKI